MVGRRNDVLSDGYATDFGDFRSNLARRQHAALAGFCTLRKFQFDHSDRRVVLHQLYELFHHKIAFVVAHAEIGGPHIENHVGAIFVVRREAAFAGIMVVAEFERTLIQRLNCAGGQ
ncbi:hypothetical protein D3C86_1856690 [compost metagenome]